MNELGNASKPMVLANEVPWYIAAVYIFRMIRLAQMSGVKMAAREQRNEKEDLH